MKCESCERELPDGAALCPFCRASQRGDGLARGDEGVGWLARETDDRLARSAVASMLARTESLGDLIREDALAGPLSVGELRSAAQRAVQDDKGADELDRLIPEEMLQMNLDGLQLAGLVDRRAGDLAVLKTGLVLLRARRYPEALEWWTLKRAGLVAGQGRLELLLLMMEVFSFVLAGRAEDAARVKALVREHPLFQQYQKRKPGGG
jgi:hypothetical protein